VSEIIDISRIVVYSVRSETPKTATNCQTRRLKRYRQSILHVPYERFCTYARSTRVRR